ncbi:recombinase family protein [Myxacorys almedinensis]|uniref:Recombinase family protein n=1 Tax=Myxacorys almedinensis A TaxID=2690445 RepID=A0A8J7Z2Q6_9CYAN|nr:recombinase family protein [Myxacorys almedinensis]NDJ18952.1 recombinase family protein [Myxacorys almedinensis A]
MRIVAYLYSDPLLETTPDPTLWGWEIDRVYQDLATEKTPRMELQQLLSDCQTKPAEYLLIRRLEELGDSMEDVRDRLSHLESLNVKVISIESTEPNLQSEFLNFLQQLQRNQQSRRIRQGHARNRVKALAPPGKAPYGYRRSRNRYLLDRSTAPVVKEFFERFLLFGSVRGAVRYLEKQYGKKISVSTGSRWLTNPVYRGDLEYQNGDVLSDTHTAIISRDEAAQVDRLLRRNRRLPSRTASAPRSLAGLVRCKMCHSPMTIARVTQSRSSRRKNAKEYLYLRPTQCSNPCSNQPKCKAIAYDAILQRTIEQICEELPRAVSGVELPDVEGIKQKIGSAIAQKQAILDQIPSLLERGVLDLETADLRQYNLRAELAELQGKLAQLPPVNLSAIAQTVSIPQFWFDLSESERRFYFREFIRQVELIREGAEWELELNFIF